MWLILMCRSAHPQAAVHGIFVFVDAYNNTRYYNYLYSLSTSPFWPRSYPCVSKKSAVSCTPASRGARGEAAAPQRKVKAVWWHPIILVMTTRFLLWPEKMRPETWLYLIAKSGVFFSNNAAQRAGISKKHSTLEFQRGKTLGIFKISICP